MYCNNLEMQIPKYQNKEKLQCVIASVSVVSLVCHISSSDSDNFVGTQITDFAGKL